MKIQWLCDSSQTYSYARVTGFICIMCNLVWRLYMGIGDLNNMWQAVVGCSGFITGVLLWLIEIFRRAPDFTIKAGNKEVSLKRNK